MWLFSTIPSFSSPTFLTFSMGAVLASPYHERAQSTFTKTVVRCYFNTFYDFLTRFFSSFIPFVDASLKPRLWMIVCVCASVKLWLLPKKNKKKMGKSGSSVVESLSSACICLLGALSKIPSPLKLSIEGNHAIMSILHCHAPCCLWMWVISNEASND